MGQSVHPKGFRLIKLKNWENRECIVEKEKYVESLNFQREVEAYLDSFFNRTLSRRLLKSIKKIPRKRKLLRWFERARRGRILSREIKRLVKKVKIESVMEVAKRGKKREFRTKRWRQKWKWIILRMLKEVRRAKRRKRKEIKKFEHWSRKFQFRIPRFIYSHTVFLKRNGLLGLNVVLYTNIGMREVFKDRWVSKEARNYYRVFLEKRWKEVLKKVLESRLSNNFFKSGEKFNLKLHFIKGPWLNASFCARYLGSLLKRRKGNFSRIVENLLYRPRYYGGYKHNLYGVYITGAGRFTRRQRASFKKNQRGRIPFSTITAPVEYADVSVPLKYGACSVKVWICHLRK